MEGDDYTIDLRRDFYLPEIDLSASPESTRVFNDNIYLQERFTNQDHELSPELKRKLLEESIHHRDITESVGNQVLMNRVPAQEEEASFWEKQGHRMVDSIVPNIFMPTMVMTDQLMGRTTTGDALKDSPDWLWKGLFGLPFR